MGGGGGVTFSKQTGVKAQPPMRLHSDVKAMTPPYCIDTCSTSGNCIVCFYSFIILYNESIYISYGNIQYNILFGTNKPYI